MALCIPLVGCVDSAGNTIGSAASHAYTETNITNNISAAIWGGGGPGVSDNFTLYIIRTTVPMTATNVTDALGYTPEDVANKSTDVALGTSDTLYPSQNAVKSYVDTEISGLTPLVTGNVTATAPLSLDEIRMVIGGALNISMLVATINDNGYLASTDWNTFNSKQDALGFTPVADTTTVDGHALSSNVTIHRIVYLKVIADNATLATGDGQAYFTVPLLLNGLNLIDADAAVYTASSSGTPTVMVYNVTDSEDMLSVGITIDATEYSSYSADTAPTIDGTHDDVATGDRIRIDVDVKGTGTQGLDVTLVFG